MKANLSVKGCTLVRENNDSRVYHESTVVSRMRDALNRQGHNFRRINPSRYGLTSCRLGLWDRKAKVILWHERYAVENAATEFNHGSVFFMRTDEAA
jgi:hypothetical protein